MLRRLIHLRHRLANLGHTLALLLAGGTDLGHQIRHPADRRHDVGHGGTGLVHQLRALLHPLHAGADQGLDFLGCLGTALGQGTHLARHHGKTTALLTGARCFHGRIQRQNIGLEGDGVDDGDDVGNLLTAVVDALHGFHHFGHHGTAMRCHLGSIHRHLIGGTGVVGVLAHGRAQLLHGGGGFLQRTGLLLGATGEISIARGNL